MGDQGFCETPIVELLRAVKIEDGWCTFSEKPEDPMAGSHMHGDLLERAADEIVRLREENADLKSIRVGGAHPEDVWRARAEKAERELYDATHGGEEPEEPEEQHDTSYTGQIKALKTEVADLREELQRRVYSEARAAAGEGDLDE